MERPSLLFVALFGVIAFLLVGGVLADPIIILVRRRIPRFSYHGETFLLFGLILVAFLSLGLVVAYLLLRGQV